ncbi:MAG: leucine-rich repeat protein, partial [archaeon]|nr:leucine-rich repeat protein [archaeon]
IQTKTETNPNLQKLKSNIKKIFFVKNNLTVLNLDKLLLTFPELEFIDFSHNNLKDIIYTNEPEKVNNINTVDFSFNNFNNTEPIMKIFSSFPKLNTFIFYANPLKKEILHIIPSIYKQDYSETEINEIKEKYSKLLETKDVTHNKIIIDPKVESNAPILKYFDMLFDSYSIGSTYNEFSSCKYFRENEVKDTNFKTLNLSKQKLLEIPEVHSASEIEILFLNINKIKKINNLEPFTSLIELYLQSNKIKQIENLPSNIIKLDLSNNELQSLDGISQAPNLKWLNVENNAISTIQELNSLKKLIEFYCAGNYLTDIRECYQLRQILSLEIIDISSNDVCRTIHDIRLGMIFYCKKLKNFNRINIDSNERAKANEYFTGKLTNEILESRLGTDYDLENITELDLSSLKLKDEIRMFNKDVYPKLTKLNLSKNLFKSFDIFGYLPNLVELNLNYNIITAIFLKGQKKVKDNGICGLPNLESLEIAGNSLENITGINYLTSLKILVLRENSLSKIDSLTKMKNLTFLDLSFNKLRNVDRTNVGTLPSLQILLCDNNFLKNVNGFDKLTSLQTISFENNKIFDYNSLDKLATIASLRDFNVGNNPITKTSNYRTKMIKMFENLTKLDGVEIADEEREMLNLEMQMGGDFTDEAQLGNYYQNSFQNFNPAMYQKNPKMQKGNSKNINNMQEKNLRKINMVQLNLMNYHLLNNFSNPGLSSNMIALPKIRPPSYGYGNNPGRKPTSSDIVKKKTNPTQQPKGNMKVGGQSEGNRRVYGGMPKDKDYYAYVAPAFQNAGYKK